MWEGVVVNKYSKEKYKHRDEPETYTEFTVVIQIDTGKKKTIVEIGSRRKMYDYLSVGDRVRYHPKFDSYEKYDKSKAKYQPAFHLRCRFLPHFPRKRAPGGTGAPHSGQNFICETSWYVIGKSSLRCSFGKKKPVYFSSIHA
jgi:hypothetical protein